MVKNMTKRIKLTDKDVEKLMKISDPFDRIRYLKDKYNISNTRGKISLKDKYVEFEVEA